MDYEQIKELIKTIETSALTEFELSYQGVSLKMSKLGGKTVVKNEILPAINISEPITLIPEEKKVVKEGQMILSPLVGTFYESGAPGKPAFVKIGDRIKKGDVLCIVEAMKVMNEITSAYDGQVAEVMVKNEQMVEFNQPLYRIV